MKIFYMHLVTGGQDERDETPYERADLTEMREEAILAAREVMAMRIKHGVRPRFDARFVIEDQSGNRLAEVSFDEAVRM